MVKELLLGDNAFIGVNHLSQEKARAEAKETTIENKARVIEAAVEGGATGFTFSTHERNLELLSYMNDHKRYVLNKLNYYVLVPHAQMYVRKANTQGTPSLISSVLKDTTHVKKSSIFDVLATLITLQPERFAELFIEAELAPYLKILPKPNVKAVLLHEVFSELIIAHGLFDMASGLGKKIEEKLKPVCFGLETRNFGYLYDFLLKFEYYPKYLMTPFNSLGYQMAPTKESVEKAVAALNGKSKVIAINMLASGALSLDESIDYVKQYQDSLYAVCSSSTKPERILSNFTKLSQAFLQNGTTELCIQKIA